MTDSPSDRETRREACRPHPYGPGGGARVSDLAEDPGPLPQAGQPQTRLDPRGCRVTTAAGSSRHVF